MATIDWLTGIYLTTNQVLKYPDYVERLRDEIGLNTVVMDFSGELPKDVLAKSPYGGRVPTEEELGELVLRHFDGRPVDPREYDRAQALCGPGVSATGDDEVFRQAVGQLKDAGLKVWTHGGAWTIRRLMFCPSRVDVREWMEAVCVHWATQYGLDALDITHFRYPMGSFPLGLFGCTCSSCRATAGEMGYDMDAMVADLSSAREGLQNLDGTRLSEVLELGIGFFDVIHALGLRSGVLDWVRFRCDLVVRNLSRFKAAVHKAAPETPFGTDTYPASMALTAGHDYLRWGEMADFASPLVSHHRSLRVSNEHEIDVLAYAVGAHLHHVQVAVIVQIEAAAGRAGGFLGVHPVLAGWDVLKHVGTIGGDGGLGHHHFVAVGQVHIADGYGAVVEQGTTAQAARVQRFGPR